MCRMQFDIAAVIIAEGQLHMASTDDVGGKKTHLKVEKGNKKCNKIKSLLVFDSLSIDR